MQAYATAEIVPPTQLRVLDRRSVTCGETDEIAEPANAVLDELLGRLADLVAAKVAARLASARNDAADEWFDTRGAAKYLGIHRDSLRRLAAEGTIAAEQAAAGCKLFFRRSELDAWRCPSSAVGIRSRCNG